ncbi:transporter substrate-binding domain-containing protein [Zooshikella marina]|uniref:substrate-binding periplasmic protein n=1 Tax=Zooshikella ganghwensis TaxID=202772 RepID=UPI001BB00CBF|nr:transporter substrate-binding domain-containing protein [Zooshikella ganghwensis]MBU2705361.1 transporter substrate-binding domain-containing protein [Zooshikella ganghwensis]
MRYWLFLCTFLTALSTHSSAEDVKFRLITENFPPYNYSIHKNAYEHKEENIGGLAVEVVQALFQRADLSYSMKLRQWNYAYAYAQRRPFRGVFGTTLTEARKPLFKWVGPLISNDWMLFAKADFSGNIASEEDLKPYKIGAYKGDVRAEYLKSKGFNVSEVDNDRVNPKRLATGLIDLWISGGYSGSYYAKEAGVTNIKPVYTVRKSDLYLAMHKETPQKYIDQLNQVLNDMRNEGFITNLTQKYEKSLGMP